LEQLEQLEDDDADTYKLSETEEDTQKTGLTDRNAFFATSNPNSPKASTTASSAESSMSYLPELD
jgi:hypothetical protein